MTCSLAGGERSASVPRRMKGSMANSVTEVFSGPTRMITGFISSISGLVGACRRGRSLGDGVSAICRLRIGICGLRRRGTEVRRRLRLGAALSRCRRVGTSIMSHGPSD